MSIEATPCKLDGVVTITPKRFIDPRGYFSELYSRQALAEIGISADFCQDNISLSALPGTLRGLHFQKPPYAQGKLVAVLQGAVLDVIVDLRTASPTYRQFVSFELSAERGNQVWIPAGFAHGVCTLQPDTILFYKVTAPYSPAHDAGIIWDDPDIGIAWPAVTDRTTLSDKDRALPPLRMLEKIF